MDIPGDDERDEGSERGLGEVFAENMNARKKLNSKLGPAKAVTCTYEQA